MMAQQEFWKLSFQTLSMIFSLITLIMIHWQIIQEPVYDRKIQNHPSKLIIREVCKKNTQFSFKWADKDEILKEVLNLDAWKACQDSDIPSRIIKKNADLWIEFLHSSFNNLICQYESPSIFKLANIISEWQKKDDRNF